LVAVAEQLRHVDRLESTGGEVPEPERIAVIDLPPASGWLHLMTSRFVRALAIQLLIGLAAIHCGADVLRGADISFNINYIAESQPIAPAAGSTFFYGDVWSENGYVYVGSDRGVPRSGHASNGQAGVSVFSLSNAGVPTFLPPPTSPPSGFQPTTYFGNEMEDLEVYDGIGYFGSDYNPSTASLRTGVDIVDLSIPFDPIMMGRIDETDCLVGNPSVCAHGKVHTVSIQRINENTPSEQRFLYTSDNETSVIKISDVTNPANPQLIKSLPLPGVSSSVDAHEVVVRNNILFVASKNPSKGGPGHGGTGEGWVHIYDVSTPSNPLRLKHWESGTSTHTAMPSYDGNTLVVAEEREDGNVLIYDISAINIENDPDPIPPPVTLNRTSVGITAYSPHHVHVHGNLLFMPWYEAGLQVFNISDPLNPVHVGAFDTCLASTSGGPCAGTGTSTNFNGNWGVDLSMGLNRVLLSDRTRGLIVVDASGVVIPGDYNQDMVVDAADYAVWRGSFGSTRSSVHDAPLADGNFNGVVDASDYVIWRKNFGNTGPGGGSIQFNAAVPEPASLLLFAMGIGLVISRGRSRSV
jgi:hypothetical protein